MRMPSVRYTNPKLSSSAITFGFAFMVLLKKYIQGFTNCHKNKRIHELLIHGLQR